MPELSLKTQNAEALARVEKEQRKMQKREQVLAFAKEQLGLSGKRAKALRKLGAAYFKLDTDGLKFRGAGDKLLREGACEHTDADLGEVRAVGVEQFVQRRPGLAD